MTLGELKAAVQKANLQFEHNPRVIDKYGTYNAETGKFEPRTYGYYFGIRNLSGRDQDSWTWFESIGEGTKDEDMYCFVERYSCRTGHANKGWRERYKAYNRIEILSK